MSNLCTLPAMHWYEIRKAFAYSVYICQLAQLCTTLVALTVLQIC